MAPIHDTDLAEERWAKGNWAHYELWEQIEHRLRRRKRLWITGTAVAFLILSSVPILKERWPRWEALVGARRLSREMGRVKIEASLRHAALRLSLSGSSYEVAEAANCRAAPGRSVWTGGLFPGRDGEYSVVSAGEGRRLGLDGLSLSFCYSPFEGAAANDPASATLAFALAPARDLADERGDRAALVIVAGKSAEISFH